MNCATVLNYFEYNLPWNRHFIGIGFELHGRPKFISVTHRIELSMLELGYSLKRFLKNVSTLFLIWCRNMSMMDLFVTSVEVRDLFGPYIEIRPIY